MYLLNIVTYEKHVCVSNMGFLPKLYLERLNFPSGCKFSLEEERVVIELQAEFGNKWARIATYLPGRTDNDVKNFWSSRQKRLARILQTSATSSKSQKNKGVVPGYHEVCSLEVNGIHCCYHLQFVLWCKFGGFMGQIFLQGI